MAIRGVLVDDHPVFRDGLRVLFAATPDVELTGEAADGVEGTELVATVQPDVVLMDLQMPGRNGIEATRELATRVPQARVVVLTMFEDDASVFSAMRAGARGYLVKGADAEAIHQAVRAVAAGEAVFGGPIASRILGYFANPRLAGPVPFPDLTDREREILGLIATGLSNDAIAERLGISQKTGRNAVSLILDKLEVADRAAAIVQAREAGLGGGPRGGAFG